MERREFLRTAAIGGTALAAAGLACSLLEKEKPNIIFIICDDLNDAITGFGGHPQAKTPFTTLP